MIATDRLGTGITLLQRKEAEKQIPIVNILKTKTLIYKFTSC